MTISHLVSRARHYATLNNGVLAAAAIIVLTSIWNTVETLQRNFLLQQKVDLLSQQVRIAEVESETLALEQQYLHSAEYQELTARAKLGKAAPGEKLINLPPTPKAQPVTQEIIRRQPEQTNFEKWIQFFFGKRAAT